MHDFGQFLAGPGAFLNVAAPGMIWGLAALCATFGCAVTLVLRPLFPEARWRNAVFAIPLLALGGTAAVLLLQWGAGYMYAEGHFQGFSSMSRFGPGILLVWALQGIGGIIGWGYSESVAPRCFENHVASFTVGVALLEEMVKGLLGLASVGLLYYTNNPRNGDPFNVGKPRILALVGVAFLLGGMSYGAGEAVFYFQVYAGAGTPIWIYLTRAVWCVCLHGAWAFLTGMSVTLLVEALMQKGDVLFTERKDMYTGQLVFLVVLLVYMLCCAPAAILHGLYDAACLHDDRTAWIVGGISLAACPLLLASLAYFGRRAVQTAGAVSKASPPRAD